MRRLVVLLISALLLFGVQAQSFELDMEMPPKQKGDSAQQAPLKGNWMQQVIESGFHIHDPRINYPKFPKFCLKVYDWGNDTFNSYDTTYVVGTGKNWKFYLNSYNWSQSYGYIFDLSKNENVLIRSRMNADFGFSLNFMALSIGYMWNVNHWITGNNAPRKTFDLAFTCSRFSAELRTLKTSGNARIRRFGNYNDGHKINIPLDDIHQQALSVSAYYFFNYKRYSQAAAYTYSKYQLKSAGTWLAGFRYGHQKMDIDFSDVPDVVLHYLPNLPRKNHFNFSEYSLMGGYAYNWVLPHHWTINLTALPSVGYRHSRIENKNLLQEKVSINMTGRLSFTYNHRAFFLSGIGRADGNFIFSKDYDFFNSNQSVSLLIGFRF